MNFFWQATFLLLIVWLLIAQLYIVALPLYLWYLFRFEGYELILVAILIDGYYLAFYSLPLLSILTVILAFFVGIIKPHLLLYTDKNEMVS